MPETIEKLRPDRDLQCYYFDESAIAAMSETSPNGFTVSGTWRQQFDWCVIEWNRDNVFEHPAFRTLPDGDLSGLVLTYDETRENCIPLDSDLSPTVDWPFLRVWVRDNEGEQIYFVPLKDHAEHIEGSYSPAYADFTLGGTVTGDQTVGLSYTGNYADTNLGYTIGASSSLEYAALTFPDYINPDPDYINPDDPDDHDDPKKSRPVRAERVGDRTIRVHYTAGKDKDESTTGANGNRFGMFTWAQAGGVIWDAVSKTFANGTSPTKWRITLDFSTLKGYRKDPDTGLFIKPEGAKEFTKFDIPACKARKLRWTYAADLQPGEFVRSEFKAAISNWTVTGTGRTYSVAGLGSRRIEDNDPRIVYNGHWHTGRGNFSGGTVRYTMHENDSVTINYIAGGTHDLYIGTRYLDNGVIAAFEVDGTALDSVNLNVPSEDVLIRVRLGTYGSGSHTVTMRYHAAGRPGFHCYRLDFDFLELVVPTTELPTFPDIPGTTVATDWDTLHSVAISPERTAWMIRSLGFTGRQNHYIGALLFYETHSPANRYARGTVTFSGTPTYNSPVSVSVGPEGGLVTISRFVQFGETVESIAQSFALEFNKGYTTIWAEADGGTLTIHARQRGGEGNDIQLLAAAASGMTADAPIDGLLTGGEHGDWLTDLEATPRLNRAMRDWTRSFLTALDGYGIDAVCAFSTELKHGDPSEEAAIAQRDNANAAILLPTPAIQTNFSPTSLAYWRQVHADCAQIMDESGMTPFLQFGEEQWWYFNYNGIETLADGRVDFASMPFYDAWAKAEFEARYGRPMAEIANEHANPADYPDEVEFLADVLGDFTTAIIDYVRASHPEARFEVLYPFDVNNTLLNRAINFPEAAWTPAKLTSLKTEGLRYTFGKDLKSSEEQLDMGIPLGFSPEQRSHLTGLGDYTAPWLKEARIAIAKGFESVVLFALDQFCLIGYELPLRRSGRRTVRVNH